MTLPAYPSQISFLDLQNEFGGSGPIGMDEYYAKSAGYVFLNSKGKPGGTRTSIPTSGQVSLDNFHGSRKTNYVQLTGSSTWTVPDGVNYIDFCLVAGGGGGGCGTADGGGGGGAGGVIKMTGVAVTPGWVLSYSVGAGGAGQRISHGIKGTGTRLTINGTTYTASGGGFGAGEPIYDDYGYPDSDYGGGNGGSGGGGSGYYGPRAGGTGVSGQGNNGGTSADNYCASGGGAGAAATNGYGSVAGIGADANTTVSLMDATVLLGYVGGGGGHGGSFDSRNNVNLAGGLGGGGTGGVGLNGGYAVGGNGTALTGGGGGGGGGGWGGTYGTGGNGGSGVIYICYYT